MFTGRGVGKPVEEGYVWPRLGLKSLPKRIMYMCIVLTLDLKSSLVEKDLFTLNLKSLLKRVMYDLT
jgi:hypothetical protein